MEKLKSGSVVFVKGKLPFIATVVEQGGHYVLVKDCKGFQTIQPKSEISKPKRV